MRPDDTIFALSSGSLPAGLAVVRLSGTKAFPAAEALAGSLGSARQAVLRQIRRVDGTVIDRGLVITFPAPRSFTGEDCVELHLHGSRAVVEALYATLAAMGLRLAEAGEFSRRALESGKLDLVEAEGLADLLRAETEMQRRLAIEQSEGGLSAIYNSWALDLTRARALIEAELDFADEEDVPGAVSHTIWPAVREVKTAIDQQLSATSASEIIRDGFKIAIVGEPNVGKSSLLNALARRDIAIVTEIPGTTRDVLHVDLDLDGFLIRFFDTAGIRETHDVVEKEGIRRALAARESADLVLFLTDAVEAIRTTDSPSTVREWNIVTKADLLSSHSIMAGRYRISSLTGEGIDELKAGIKDLVAEQWQAIAELRPGRIRHAQLLRNASNFIDEALEGSELDIQAECLRLAAEELGRITGRVDVEQLLDIVFSEFCIGK